MRSVILREYSRIGFYIVGLFALMNVQCSRNSPSYEPEHYLLISHTALNRITIFDLTKDTIVGALPTQKLPHDMLVSANRMLYVVNSGAQSISTYDLKNRELWNYARQFMKKDSANLYASRSFSPMNIRQNGSGTNKQDKDTAAWITLNKDPVQSLPLSFSKTYLTDSHFSDIAKSMHEKVNATSHTTCFDCHDRSIGAKPFGMKYSVDSSEIFVVHLAYRNITFLDAKTLSIKRQIPVPIPPNYSPIEAWITPQQNECFVTCRNEIGQSKSGLIIVMDLHNGTLLKSITAGIYPWHFLADQDGKRLYINNFQSSRISIVDVEKKEIVDSIIVQNGPSMMLLIPDRHQLVVSCFYTDRVLFVDLPSKKVIKTVDVDSNPTSLEFSSDGNRLYVLCGGESSLNVIDVQAGRVVERHKMLFGAYAFHSVDERSLK